MKIVAGFAMSIAGKRHFLDSAVNTSLLERLECSGLSMGQSGFDSSLGEDPTSAASPHEEKFRAARADAVANSGNLLALA